MTVTFQDVLLGLSPRVRGNLFADMAPLVLELMGSIPARAGEP